MWMCISQCKTIIPNEVSVVHSFLMDVYWMSCLITRSFVSTSSPLTPRSSSTVQAACRQNWVMGNLRPAVPITSPPESRPPRPWMGFKHHTRPFRQYLSASAELLLTAGAVHLNDLLWTAPWVCNTLFEVTAKSLKLLIWAQFVYVGHSWTKASARSCQCCVSDGFKEPKRLPLYVAQCDD